MEAMDVQVSLEMNESLLKEFRAEEIRYVFYKL